MHTVRRGVVVRNKDVLGKADMEVEEAKGHVEGKTLLESQGDHETYKGILWGGLRG
jgi:hypothetical protein